MKQNVGNLAKGASCKSAAAHVVVNHVKCENDS